MKQAIITTLGHIDHGKSALVRALTGQEPDRWAEEQRRGITLDLGFAWVRWGEVNLAFVDVPGHEDLIHNMLAGQGGVQGCLLVVAADEGIKPQTREHFEIAQALGYSQGLIALTRADLASPARIAEVAAQVKELLQGSFLELAPVIACSALTGQGLVELRQALAAWAAQLTPPHLDLPFRLAIDRAFSLKGQGRIVTGSLAQGSLAMGEELMLYPEELPLKFRRLHSQNQAIEQAQAGMRLALNLAGSEGVELRRGQQLAKPGSLVVTEEFYLQAQWLERAQPKPRMSLSLYCHAQTSPARLQQVNADLYRVKLDQPWAIKTGDRLVLRSFSTKATWGGGRVLYPLPLPENQRPQEAVSPLLALAGEQETAMLEAALWLAGKKGLTPDQAGPLTGLSQQRVKKAKTQLQAQGTLVAWERWRHDQRLREWESWLLQEAKTEHQTHPEEPGFAPSLLKGKLANWLDAKEVQPLLDWFCKQKTLAKTGQFYHLQDFQGGFSLEQRAMAQAIAQDLASRGFKPAKAKDLAQSLQAPLAQVERLLELGRKRGLWAEREEWFFSLQALSQAEEAVTIHFQTEASLSVIQFKNILSLSRKEAVLLLEILDQQGLTYRQGEARLFKSGRQHHDA